MRLRLWRNVFLDMNGFVLHLIPRITTQYFIGQMFSTTGQSPCDVAVELASACFSTSKFASFSVFNVRSNPRKTSISSGPTPPWIRIFWTWPGLCKRLLVQLGLLLIAERLCILSRARYRDVNPISDDFPECCSRPVVLPRWSNHIYNCTGAVTYLSA